MPQSYCQTTAEWAAFSSRSRQLTQETVGSAMHDALQFMVKQAEVEAPWQDDTGQSRAEFIGFTSTDPLPPTVQGTDTPNDNEVRGYLARLQGDHGEYLLLMEQGKIGGWGNPPPVQSWDPASRGYKSTEELVMENNRETFISLVRQYFFDHWNRKIGTFRFS